MAQHLSLFCRIAMSHKINRFDSGTYYAEGDTSSDSNSDSDTKPKPKNKPDALAEIIDIRKKLDSVSVLNH
ncbi:19137_t:CDS:2 [Entrophospora sp. SA101]|nr:19137_t:CDS:2 [Entrophospora sp. SA101]